MCFSSKAFSSFIATAGGTAIGSGLASFGKKLIAALASLFSAAFVSALAIAITAVLSWKKVAEQIGNLVASGGTRTDAIPIEEVSDATKAARRYRKAADERMYKNRADAALAQYQLDRGEISARGVSANKMTWDKEKGEYSDISWLQNKLYGVIYEARPSQKARPHQNA